jgi:alkanesulfonate monooxygenase SsuD/methylene tetrahydromethanopterin reductase-like flavin-dependent oxidoreductase (luciferase family)
LPDLTMLADWLVVVDDVVLPGWLVPDLETAADEIRAECAEVGRDPATLGVAVLVPVSIGRTNAEAAARAEMDPEFSRFGDPARTGIFGTLEECQDRVIALAHAGVTDIRCILPGTPDVHDVIAQLTACTVGSTDVLRPGSLRSAAPPPPDGWGGRPPKPLDQRVSAGSRRR